MLLGRGALANYHDLPLPHRQDFQHWHTTEHLPERVGLRGFLRGRRYQASDVSTSPDYFILYETTDVSVLHSEHYVARLDAPTPWTARVSGQMARTLRTAARVHASSGRGVGGHLLTVRLHPEDEDLPLLRQELDEAAVSALARRPGICGAHVLIADEAVTTVNTAERALRDPPDEMVPWTILLEGTGGGAPEDAWESLATTLPGATAGITGSYALQTLFTLCDL